MISVLYFAFNAVAPILILILLGYYANRKGLLPEAALKAINKFNFKIPFFCLMFNNLYAVEKIKEVSVNLIVVVFAIPIILTIVGWAMSGLVTKDPAKKSVLIQATYRSNSAIIGLALATALAGEEAKALASIVQIPTVIYYNLITVVILSIYSKSETEVKVSKVLKGIVTNPLILGLMSGCAVLIIRHFMPVNADGKMIFSLREDLPWLYQVIENLSGVATPIALIVLGGQFKVSRIKALKKELICGILLRLIFAPIIVCFVIFIAQSTGYIVLTKASVAMFTAICGSPMAVSAVVMCREMGADSELAGQIVVWTSILGMGTLFIITCLLKTVGLL